MKLSNNKNIIIGLACAVAVAAAWQMVGASTSTGSGSPLRWEHAQLRVQGDRIVFSQGTQESVVIAPSSKLGGGRTGGGRMLARYALETTAKRNHVVAALDVFGKKGWEVASVTSTGTEMVVLMKRPY